MGVSWNIGRTFLEQDEVYQFNLVPDAGHKRPGMINLQQYHVEEMLIARALELGADIRWQHKVTAVTPHDTHATLTVERSRRERIAANHTGTHLMNHALREVLGGEVEQRGSLVRRMQCVHCKGISENVTTQPSQCAHCGLWLLVRDHYSRRLGAFQGVCIHAEEPANIPPAVETFV